IPGVTINLKSAQANDDSTFKTMVVSESLEQAAERIGDFVNKFNQVSGAIRQAIRYDPGQSEQSNPTAGNSTLRNILNQLNNMTTATVSTLPHNNTIRSLADLGITTIADPNSPSQNGMLQFNESKFNEVLNTNYDEVIVFFEGIKVESVEYDGY